MHCTVLGAAQPDMREAEGAPEQVPMPPPVLGGHVPVPMHEKKFEFELQPAEPELGAQRRMLQMFVTTAGGALPHEPAGPWICCTWQPHVL